MIYRVLCLVIAVWTRPAVAQENDISLDDQLDGESSGDLLRPAQMGSLHRLVASLESTLDVYRLALSEIVLASERAADMGEEAASDPSRPLPPTVRSVFRRLSRVLASRVPAAALAPIPRGYHYEALDSLEKLAAAENLSDLPRPMRVFHRSVLRLLAVAAEVVDLFSRQRPIQVQIFDADTALAQISDALEAVSQAERRILALRKREAGLSEQFQAFQFLEVSLGNALDLIAAAEEAGIKVGFELQIELAGFKSTLGRVRARALQLAETLERMEKTPSVTLSDVVAWIALTDSKPGVDDTRLEVRFSAQGSEFSGVRVEALLDADKIAAWQLSRACGKPTDNLRDEISAAIAAKLPSHGIRLVGVISPEDEHYSSVLEVDPFVPVRLRLAAVNGFGMAGEVTEVDVEWISTIPEAPTHVRAVVSSVTPFDPEFYREFDLVSVEWADFPSDPSPAVRKWVEGFPLATRIEVFRGENQVAAVSPGTRRISDRVSREWLQAGIPYSVKVRLSDGRSVASQPCPQRETARREIRNELSLASAGAAYLKRPSALERQIEERLSGDQVALNEQWESFSSLDEPDRVLLLDAWWESVAESERWQWLDAWISLQGGAESAWFKRFVPLSNRDRDWVIASLWLREQEDFVRREVDRIWKLVHPSRRSKIERAWFESRDTEWRAELKAQLADADDTVRAGLLGPARVKYWVSTKDPKEIEIIHAWWSSLEENERVQRFSQWLERRPAAFRSELRWPSRASLTESERVQRLSSAHRELPPRLRPRFLAWWSFERLNSAELAAAIVDDVGPLRARWEQFRYRFRAFDVATGFNGILIYAALIFLLPVLWVWVRRRLVRRGTT